MKTHTLLAVDDRAENLFVVKQLFAEHLPECGLVTAESAEEGLALAAEQSFDGALIDVQMPDVDGLEMCRRLKADGTNGPLPILLITAHGSSAELRIRGLAAGADDFISRPIDNFELVAKVRVMLRIKRAEDELRTLNARMEDLVIARTRQLQESEERYRLHFENASDVIYSIDPEFRFLSVSPSVEKILGYRPEELIGKPFAELNLLAPEYLEEALSDSMRVFAGERISSKVYEFITKDGSRRFGELSSVPIFRHGKVVAIVSVARDVTERKRAEEQLSQAKETAEAASRVKSQFLANMSHEIRTPMTAIMGYTDLLLSREWSPDERREHLQVVSRQSQHLLAIIDDILDLSKIESQEVELQLTECSVSEIVEEVQSLLQVNANEKQLGLDIHYQQPLPRTIRTDADRLRQILVNLVGNAIKFTEQGGVKITLGCTRQEDGSARMQFEVADTGIGVSAEELDRLFQPFTQADMTFTRRFGGTGLGLAISQRLAQLLGGRIEVESQPGKGSVFLL